MTLLTVVNFLFIFRAGAVGRGLSTPVVLAPSVSLLSLALFLALAISLPAPSSCRSFIIFIINISFSFSVVAADIFICTGCRW